LTQNTIFNEFCNYHAVGIAHASRCMLELTVYCFCCAFQ